MDYSNASERRNIILEHLKANGQVFVNELAEEFNVSQETIRRDLNKLEELRHIKKIHGGAVSAQFGFELEFNQRARLAEDEKKAIALKAAELIKPGDSLFIDFGTTTLEFARQIASVTQLTVMTNSPVIANLFHENATTNLILIGGQFGMSKMECIGPVTLQGISAFYADYAVIGAGAVSPEAGIMDQDLNEAAIARQMIKQSNKTIVLADGHKLNNRATSLVAEWNDISWLVTTDPDNKLKHLRFPETLNIIVA
ncbi:DeoR/GlpR family DNA-binding transcription regulator [[Erwinia] mediterraneensis]|uniref:DeoR/GlpR family DNA-binding transcription regulator n=1 Tax=[Erwinia] mediterraneensis TaxID=2161819 RepID=UPI00102F7C5C|nr:DeoR/GlpR family DNA-binding transcription regulator [[Erwinia] mediterraneensis]